MSSIGHAAGETGKWIFGIAVILVALTVAVVVALLAGAFVWFFAKALVGEWKLWLVIGGLLVAALAWAQIKGD